MPDGADLSFEADAFERAGRRITASYIQAGRKAVSGTTKWMERRLEESTAATVPGRLWRAWASKFYPNTDTDPAGIVYLNGRDRTHGALKFWTEPGEVRGKRGQFLAIPLPTAGDRGRARDLTPGEWERRTGQRLQFVYRQGKPSLLVAVGGTTNGRSGAFRPLTAGRRGRVAQGRGGANPQADAVVPIFVLIRMVRHRNAFAIKPIVDAGEGELVQEFFAAIRATS